MRKFSMLCVVVLMFITSCDEPILSPKPRGFPKVVYPLKEYQAFDKDYCQFTFEYPTYATVIQDEHYFEQKPVDPCWFDLYFKDFDGRLHCSYYPIKDDKHLDKLKTDAFELVGKHNIKANFIDEIPIKKEDGTYGFSFEIDGPVASPFQMFLTDGDKHFLRAALYFNTQARPDSLAPVYRFIKKDIAELINTFEWNDQ